MIIMKMVALVSQRCSAAARNEFSYDVSIKFLMICGWCRLSDLTMLSQLTRPMALICRLESDRSCSIVQYHDDNRQFFPHLFLLFFLVLFFAARDSMLTLRNLGLLGFVSSVMKKKEKSLVVTTKTKMMNHLVMKTKRTRFAVSLRRHLFG